MPDAPFIPFVLPAITRSLGVPALFGGGAPLALLALLAGGVPGLSGLVAQQQWGIFSSSGSPILTVDAVESVEYARDYHISDYPQEQGAFMSYNKVQVPYQGKVGFLIGLNREAFLNQVETQVASLQFVTLVTPEKSYVNANLTHYGYRRVARRGMTLILVEVWVEEVRVTGTATQSSGTQAGTPQGTNGQPTSDGGQVQAVPTTAQPSNLVSGLPDQSAPPPSSPTALANPAPSIGPAFYDSTNFPVVPNDAANLAGPQLGTGYAELNDNATLDGTGTLFVAAPPPSLTSAPTNLSPAVAQTVVPGL